MLPVTIDGIESTLDHSVTTIMDDTSDMENMNLNMTNNGTSGPQPPYWSVAEQVVLCIILITIMIISLVGNAMVIISVAYFKDMQRKTYVLIANLAVADFGVSLLGMPFSLATVINNDWPFGETLCNINGFLEALFLFASIHGLMHISIHKYFQLSKPLKTIVDKKWATVMITATWVVAFTVAMAPIVKLTTNEYKPGTSQCGPAFPTENTGYIHAGYAVLMGFIIPWTVLALCYGFIFKSIRSHGNRMSRHSSMGRDRVFKQQRKISITLFIVFIVFFICWSPFIIFNIFGFTIGFDNIPIWPNVLCYWMGYLNSAINPVIYGWRNRSFNKAFKEIVCCCNVPPAVKFGDNGAAPQRGRASSRRRMLYPPITPSSPDYVPDKDRFKFLERNVSHISHCTADSSRRRNVVKFHPETRSNAPAANRWSTTSDQPLSMVLEHPPPPRSKDSSPRKDKEDMSSTAHSNPAFVADEIHTSIEAPFESKHEEKSDKMATLDESPSEDIKSDETQAELSKGDGSDLDLGESPADQSPSQAVETEVKVHIDADDDKDCESGLGCSPSSSSNEHVEGESDQESNISNVVPSLKKKSSYEQMERQSEPDLNVSVPSNRRKSSIAVLVAPIVANIAMIAVPKSCNGDDNETLL